MTREELLSKLRSLHSSSDVEKAHGEADDALLVYLADEEIAEAYNAVEKWYA